MSDPAKPWKSKEQKEGGCRNSCCLDWLSLAWLGWDAGEELRHGKGFAPKSASPALHCW